MTMEFFLPMIPPTATHQMKGVARGRERIVFYETTRVQEARGKFMAALARHAPASPLRPPVRLVVKWLFPAGRKNADGDYRTTRPDTDNLQKLFKDCMAGAGFFADDCHVASEVAEKFWAKTPGIWVRVEEMGGGDA